MALRGISVGRRHQPHNRRSAGQDGNDGWNAATDARQSAWPRREGNNRILGGGDIARQFLDAGLLDTIEIGTIPIILGSGIPAFGKTKDHWLDLAFAMALTNGAAHSRYKVRR